jgi:hypothetical protein
MKRPPALSDSLIYIGNYNFVSNEQFITDYKVPINGSTSEDIALKDLVTGRCAVFIGIHGELIFDYIIRFLTHICLISLFETLFFFMFVSVDEDAGVLATTNYYTSNIISNCRNLTQNEIILISDVLKLFVNASTITRNGLDAATQRSAFNSVLKATSWNYVIGLFATLCGFIGIAKWKKYTIHWTHIICENLVLVCLLGLYEYMFFLTVIKKYATETPAEISALFINGLQNQCQLLKN